MSGNKRGKGAIGRTYAASSQQGGKKGGTTPPPQQQKPPAPKGPPPARVITWTPPASVQAGAAVDIGTMGASATGTGGALRLEFPLGPFRVGQGGPNLRVVAPGDGVTSSDGTETATVAVTAIPRGITSTPPAEPVLVGMPITPQLFAAVPSAGAGNVTIVEPSPAVAAVPGKLRVVLGLDANGDHAAAAPVPHEIDVVLPKRKITWAPPASLQYGAPLGLAELGASASGEGGELVLEYPQGPLAVGQNGINLKIVAPGREGAWEAGEETASITITPAPRTMRAFVPKKPLQTGAVVTAATFRAKGSVGDEVPVVTKPAGGKLLQVGGEVDIELTLTAGNYEGVVTPLKVKVEKGTPKLTLTSSVASVVRNATVDATWLTATIEPDTLEDELVYKPAIGSALTVADQVFLSVQFPGNDDFERTDPVDVRITVAANANSALGAEDMNDETGARDAILARYIDTRTTELLDDWDNDEGGMKTRGQKVMAEIQCMTSEELCAHMDKEVGRKSASKTTEDQLWELGGGLQVRYKANGDRFNPRKHFCMEVSKVDRSRGPQDIAFKITLGGHPGPVGNEAFVPQPVIDQRGTAKADYINGILSMTHPRILAKRKQDIDWPLAEGADIYASDDLDAMLFTARAATEVTYRLGRNPAVIKRGDKPLLAAMNGHQLRAVAAANPKYDEATVTRTFNFKRGNRT